MSSEVSIKAVFSKLRKLTNEVVQPQFITPMALKAAEIIRKRTRLGYGATQNDSARTTLEALSPKYIKYRATAGAKYLSEFTTPRRSNLTFTGQMLDSLGVVRVKAGTVYIGPTGTRREDAKKKSKRTNAQIAEYVSVVRPFLYLTKPEISQVVRFYRTSFGDLARRRFP